MMNWALSEHEAVRVATLGFTTTIAHRIRAGHTDDIPICSQWNYTSVDDFAAGTRMNAVAQDEMCLVAYPEQSVSANASKCWNWFSSRHQQRGEGEPALIAGITYAILQDYNVDPGRVYVAGLSAGAAQAVIMSATYADLYAAVGLHSGMAYGSAVDFPSALTAMRRGSPGSTIPRLRSLTGSRTVIAPGSQVRA